MCADVVDATSEKGKMVGVAGCGLEAIPQVRLRVCFLICVPGSDLLVGPFLVVCLMSPVFGVHLRLVLLL